MSIDVRKRYLLISLLSLLGGGLLLFVVLLLLGSDLLETGHGNGGADVRHDARFSISGNSTRPISPGVRVPLDLTITNPHDFDISVSGLTVKLGSVNAPNDSTAHPCTAADFALVQVATELEIKVTAGTAGTLSSFDVPSAALPHVAMLDRSVNQDGCKGATLTLDYTASGTRLNS